MKTLNFSITINAPVEKVYKTMLALDTYKEWTAAFEPTSYYEGDWTPGSKIKFLSARGGGMYSEIAENKQNEFVSIRHLGMIDANGVIDTESDEVKVWAPSYENYTFVDMGNDTEVKVDLRVPEEWEEMFNESWPKALLKLKEICER